MKSSLYSLSNITLSYAQHKHPKTVVCGLSLEIAHGSFVAIMGESGSGKTSLLASLEGFLKPTTGSVQFEGIDIYSLSRRELDKYRNRSIGIVFQSFNLIPYLSALENIMLPAMIAGSSKKESEQIASSVAEEAGIGECRDAIVSELSGGQQQRVAVARALVNNPKVVLADEPTGNLDESSARVVCDLFSELHMNRNTSIIVVTHDSRVAEYADYILKIDSDLRAS